MRLHGRYVNPEGVKKQIEGGKQTSALGCRKLGKERKSISGGWRSDSSQIRTSAVHLG